MALIHANYCKPVVIPYNGTSGKAELDRVQNMTPSSNLNREKIREVGNSNVVGYHVGIPSVSYAISQLEYGSLEAFQKFANKSSGTTTINLTDFQTSAVDLCLYDLDQAGTFKGTRYFPQMRLAGFSFNIGSPEDLMERTFNIVGEDRKILQANNQYLIYEDFSPSAGTDVDITLSATPSYNPDSSGTYMLRVQRVNGDTTTDLTVTTDYSVSGNTLTISTVNSGDEIKAYYTSANYISGESYFTENTSDAAGLDAQTATIILYDGSNNQLYKLQSVSVDVTLERYDVKEIGSSTVVDRGVRNIDVRVTLGKVLDDYTIDELLRGGGTDFGILDIRNFGTDFDLIIKIYSTKDKDTFLMGYKFTDLAPINVDETIPVNDIINEGVTMQGQTGLITSSEGAL